MKVRNMTGPNGNEVLNQFIIEDDNAKYFQSYDSIIVKRTPDKVYLDENYWNYSKTTSKYRNLFLGETTAETKRKIEAGTYVLANLNP